MNFRRIIVVAGMVTVVILMAALLNGCAHYERVEPDGSYVEIWTFMKNYNLKELTSTSQTLKADVVAVPIPRVEVETR